VVDEELAHLEKILGSQPALGSQVELGILYPKVNNNLYWVAPLLHSGFKWFNNQEGTAGYVMVSATNERDVRLVQNVAGKAIKISTSKALIFRVIFTDMSILMNATIGLADFSFEIDDAGNPYWIITKYKKKLVFGKAIGTLVVDAQSGAMRSYTIAKTQNGSIEFSPWNLSKTN
jgi:hypothetical protein